LLLRGADRPILAKILAVRVLYEKILTPGHSFGVRRISARNFTAPLHAHPEFELTLITGGVGRRLVGETLEEFGPGDLVLVGPNQPHRWTSEMRATPRRAQAWVLQFHANCLGSGFFALPELQRVERLLRRAKGGLHFSPKLAAELAPALRVLAGSAGVERMCRFLQLLGRLADEPARVLAGARETPPPRSESAGRIARVIDALERRYAEPGLTLAAIARVAAMHPSACSRFFTRTTGRTLVAYLNQVRIGHASRLLVETDQPIVDIAFACGFGTLSNFNRCFRALRGRSPREYRKQAVLPPQRTAPHFTPQPS
jgi:AraC-like DNA-binding protein